MRKKKIINFISFENPEQEIRVKGDKTIPPEEVESANLLFQKKKKIYKIILLTAWIPILAIVFTVFWLLFKNNIFAYNVEKQSLSLNSIFILMGFFLAQTLAIITLREHKNLASFRNSHFYLILECSTLIGFCTLFAAGISGYINVYLSSVSIVLLSCEFSFFITAVFYMALVIIAGMQANMYI